MSIGSRVHSHCRVVSNQIRRWFLKLFVSPTLAPMPSFGVPAASRVLLKSSPKFSQSLFYFLNSPFLLHFKKTNKKKSWCLVLNISISVYRYMFIFTVGKKMTFYSKTLSLSLSLQMSIKIKYPNVTRADRNLRCSVCATIKYTLIWGTAFSLLVWVFFFNCIKLWPYSPTQSKVKLLSASVYSFTFLIIKFQFFFSKFQLFIIQLCGLGCFGV